jgi:transposase
MQRTQRTFTKEFKVEAVQLAQTSKKPLAQIARDLGIADSTLHHWCKLFSEQGEQAFPGSGHLIPEVEEIRRLKRELEVVKTDRRSFQTRQEARSAIFEYLECFYKPIRLHSTLQYNSPAAFEQANTSTMGE